MKVVREGLVAEAPRGIENEQFAKVKLEVRSHASAPLPRQGFG